RSSPSFDRSCRLVRLGNSGIVAAIDNNRREQSSRDDCGDSETVAHDRALPPRPPTHNLELDACDASELELRFMGHGYERAKWKISLIRDLGITAPALCHRLLRVLRPASVILSRRATSSVRTPISALVVASPAWTSSAICSAVKPRASMIASE